ncbi:MAG: alginate lyase family protein [Rhodothermales bacterium]|nr:alginate lyase family protein [Rhodothermales bacterium]
MHPDSEPARRLAALTESGDDSTIVRTAAAYFRGRVVPRRLWVMPIPKERDPAFVDERADKAVKHLITTRAGEEQFGNELPWFDPAKKINTIARFPHFDYLAPAYYHSGDERYASAMVRDMMDFIRNVPVEAPDGYHVQTVFTINPWNWVLLQWRVKRWMDALVHLRMSPSLSDEQYLRIMLRIWEEVDWLGPRKVLGLHNGTLGNLSAILYAAVHFPETSRSESWLQDAGSFYSGFLDSAFYPGEFLVELTLGYSEGTLLMCLDMFDGLPTDSPTGLRLRAETRPKLERIVDAHVGMMKPDRSLPRYGDHGIYDIRDRLLRKSAALFDREDLLYLAGSDNDPDALASRQSFPFESDPYYLSGYYAMRDGWHVDANYLSMDAGPFGTNHHHGDKLSITVSGDGAEFIVDPGTSLYSSIEPGPRIDLRPGYMHNNLTVDGVDVNTGWDRHYGFDVLENRWVTNTTYDFLEGTYEFRNNLIDVIWRRSVLFKKGDYWIVLDALLGDGTRQVESNFQTMIGSDVEMSLDRVGITASNGAHLSIDSLPDDGLDPNVVVADTTFPGTTFLLQYPGFVDWTLGGRGWVGTFGNERKLDATQSHPAPAVVFKGAVALPHHTVHVLSPSKNKQKIQRSIDWLERSESRWRLAIRDDGSDVHDELVWFPTGRTDPREKLEDESGYWFRADAQRVTEIIVLNRDKIAISSGGESISISFDEPFEGVISRSADGWTLFGDRFLSAPVTLESFAISKGMLAAPRRFVGHPDGQPVIIEPGQTYEIRAQ